MERNYDKEFRIGLVLYGGVSLAIYIYGVVYEFLRLVRGEDQYAQLIERSRVKPIIDVISGSSAGGINGIFLAKALTTGADLSSLRELWIQKGDLETLINAGTPNPQSLLDSNYYETQLYEALERMKPDPDAVESKRSINLLDLFITATNLDGVVTEYGKPFCRSPIQTKQYGTVFHFKARPGHYDLSQLLQTDRSKPLPGETSELLKDLLATLRQERQGHNDFEATDQVDTEIGRNKNYYLARAAASTSAFPVAFVPVLFKEADITAMKRLFGSEVIKTTTANLGVRQGEVNQPVVYGDGGMVNNKPFSYTLETIFHRQADVPVDRKLFFVEPDPVALNETNRLANQETIDGFHSLASFFEATLYESISTDLEALFERNLRIREVNGLLADFEAVLAGYLKSHRDAQGEMLPIDDRQLYQIQPIYPTYRQLKIRALRRELEEQLVNKADLSQLIAEVTAIAPEEISGKNLAEQEIYIKNALKSRLDNLIQQNFSSLQTEQDISSFLRLFDYPFRVRRLRYFIDKLNSWLAQVDLLPGINDQLPEITTLCYRLSSIKGKLYAFIEFYQHGAWLIWDNAPPINRLADVAATYTHVSHGYAKLMDDAYKKLTFDIIGDDLAWAAKQITNLRPAGPYIAADSQYYDLQKLTAYLEDILNSCTADNTIACMEQVFNTYEFLDMYLYPATVIAQIGEADPIEVIRVSPKDATRYRDTVADKLAGEKLAHFSAFLKRSWRENDLLWGRLDAAEVIVRTILPDPVEANKILDELSPAIIDEELNSIRQRREVELTQTLLTDAEQKQLKDILAEQLTLKQVQDAETYLKEYYTTGQEGFDSIPQSYILRTTAKSLRTISRMFDQRYERDRKDGSGFLDRPLQYLTILFNLPYIFLVTLGGAEESQRKRLINSAVIFATLVFVLHLLGGLQLQSWLLLGAISLILIYVQPRRLLGWLILAIAGLLLLGYLEIIRFVIEVSWPRVLF